MGRFWLLDDAFEMSERTTLPVEDDARCLLDLLSAVLVTVSTDRKLGGGIYNIMEMRRSRAGTEIQDSNLASIWLATSLRTLATPRFTTVISY